MTRIWYRTPARLVIKSKFGWLLLLFIAQASGQERLFSVEEEGPIGQEHGAIPRSNVREIFFNQGVQSSNETFRLFITNNRANVFAINKISETLFVKERIDREKLCAAKTVQCNIDFSIMLSSTNERVFVRVNVIDINDSPPRWLVGSVLNLNLVESSAGAKLDIPLAIDADVGMNAELKYRLENNNAPFKLIYDNNRLTLETNSQLDREERTNYTMNVVASDNGVPPLSGTLLLKILVTDINDNTPRFINVDQSTRRQVREDTEPGSRIMRLEATDADEGVNGKLRFNFSKLDSVEQKVAQKYFKIHSDGDIEVIKKLDYDQMELKYFAFEVQVEDSAPYPYARSASTSVTIVILDLNDELPKMQICFFPSGCAEDHQLASISEDVQPGSNVAEILVTDADLDGKDAVKCSIPTQPSTPDAVNFELRERHDTTSNMPKAFELKTQSRFDREKRAFAQFQLECTDLAGHTASRNVTIMIKDVNDNEPQFKRDSLTLYVEENHPNLPSPIHPAILAIDADEGVNQKIQYSIGKQSQSQFQIDAASGLISAKQVFDREQQNRYLIEVIASDQGTPSLSSTATVTLLIQDRNDCIPQFYPSQSEMSVQENKPRNTRVGQVKAQDDDTDMNARVVYRLVSSDDHDDSFFHIDANTGVIKTRRVLDRENKQLYYIQVEARDQGTPSLSSTTTITIVVEDVNDHAPIFIKPTKEQSEFLIHSREPGQRITSVLAYDNDTDASAITYSVVNSKAIGYLFAIDSSGMLYVNKSVHNVAVTEWRLKISACDQGKPKPQCAIFYPLKIRLSTSGEITENDNSKATAHKRPGNNSTRTTDNEAIVVFLAIIFFVLIIALVVIIVMLRRKAVLMRKHRQQQDVLKIEDHEKRESELAGYAMVKDAPPMYEPSRRVEGEYLLSQLHNNTIKSTSSLHQAHHLYTTTPRLNHVHKSDAMSAETLQRKRSICSVDYQMLEGITAITSFSNQHNFQQRQQQPNYSSPLTQHATLADLKPETSLLHPQSGHTYYEIRPVEVDTLHKSLGVSTAVSTDSCDENNYDSTKDSTIASVGRKIGTNRRAAFPTTLQYPPYNPYAEASFV